MGQPNNHNQVINLGRHEKVMEIALRRGFLWPSYEIYGGSSGFYDYGPLGAALRKNILDIWREFYCVREGFFEISSPTIGPEEVYIASGHVKSFVDPTVECKKCGEVYRADHLVREVLGMETDGLTTDELNRHIEGIKCQKCGGGFGEVWTYNLMFRTHIGPGEKKVGYLRPETAQGMFILFNRLYGFYRKKLPFGVAQIGRAYRNEISPRQGVIRLREFTQAELEIFVSPGEKTHKDFGKVSGDSLRLVPRDGSEIEISAGEAVSRDIIAHELLSYHLILTKNFLECVGIPREKIRFRQHLKTEMAHYAADCWDAEVCTDRFGWVEVVGIADRTDYDLKAHESQSGVELKSFTPFDSPKFYRKKIVVPDMAKIGPDFKGRAGQIVERLKGLGEDEIAAFDEEGYIEFDGIRLDRNYVSIKEVEEKVTGEKITPHVIEPSFGIDRIIYCLLEAAYNERDGRNVLSFKPRVAPIQVGVFPLVAKDELTAVARKIYSKLRGEGYYTVYDESDSIGRRYSRIDEIGVPFAVTVDFDTLKDDTVTVRERDSTNQTRVKIGELKDKLTIGKMFP